MATRNTQKRATGAKGGKKLLPALNAGKYGPRAKRTEICCLTQARENVLKPTDDKTGFAICFFTSLKTPSVLRLVGERLVTFFLN